MGAWKRVFNMEKMHRFLCTMHIFLAQDPYYRPSQKTLALREISVIGKHSG
jgi:hypothetical protein